MLFRSMKEALQGATNKKEKPETLMGLEFLVNEAEQALDEWQDENDKELSILRALNDEGENNSSDWHDGATMIRGDYWIDYVKDLCDDVGDLPKNLPHYIAIDWEKTSQNIAVDYTTVDFNGVNYYIRSC